MVSTSGFRVFVVYTCSEYVNNCWMQIFTMKEHKLKKVFNFRRFNYTHGLAVALTLTYTLSPCVFYTISSPVLQDNGVSEVFSLMIGN
jgi:uncharacterized membrane protein